MSGVTAISLLACLLGAGMIMVIRSVRPGNRSTLEPAGWLNAFSIERYRPMLRLVDDANDAQWASLQDSLTPKQAERYRSQRCHILRGYLKEIDRDFERMMKAGYVLMGPEEPQLALTLRRCQLSFSRELKTAHRQLSLYARGAGSVELEKLLAAFDGALRELRSLKTPAASLAA